LGDFPFGKEEKNINIQTQKQEIFIFSFFIDTSFSSPPPPLKLKMCAMSIPARFGAMCLGYTGVCLAMAMRTQVYHMPASILDNKDIADPSKVKIVVSKRNTGCITYDVIPLNDADKMKPGKISEADVLSTIANPGNMNTMTQRLWLVGSTLAGGTVVAAAYTHVTGPKWLARPQPNVVRGILICLIGVQIANGFLDASIGMMNGIPDFARTRVFTRVARDDERGKEASLLDALLNALSESHYDVTVTHPDVSVKSDSFF